MIHYSITTGQHRRDLNILSIQTKNTQTHTYTHRPPQCQTVYWVETLSEASTPALFQGVSRFWWIRQEFFYFFFFFCLSVLCHHSGSTDAVWLCECLITASRHSSAVWWIINTISAAMSVAVDEKLTDCPKTAATIPRAETDGWPASSCRGWV